MSATSLDLSQIKTDALSAAASFRTLIGLGSGNTPTFLGASLTGGTVTASAPLINATQTWNNAGTVFTGILANVTDTASSSSSLLMDLQTGGVSRFSVNKSGTITGTRTLESGNLIDLKTTGYSFGLTVNFQGGLTCTSISTGNITWAGNNGADASFIYGPTLALRGTGSAYITDCLLTRDAAQTLAQRNSTNAQTFRIYNTFTDASNYERGKLEWASNVLRIGTEKAGTGSARALELQTDGTTRLTIGSTGNIGIGTGSTVDLLTVRAITAGTPQGITISGETSVRHATLTLSHDQRTAKIGLSRLSGDIISANAIYELVATNNDSICLVTNNANSHIRFLTGTAAEALRITNLGLLTFGGTTSSFPAIKRNAAALNFRLADDSADADITAAALTLSGNLTISTKNIVTDTTTGTKIGTGTTQKLGFFNATPVVQPTAVADATDAASVITQLNALLSRMRDLGLIAT